MVAPLCIPKLFWNGRNDAYRSAKEGSYSMVRMFIEFLGVKSDRKNAGKLVATGGGSDSVLIGAFAVFGTKQLSPLDFGADEEKLVAQMHRTLCKINAHFTYDPSKTVFYDRIASPDDDEEWARTVDIVVQKLDKHFYSVVGQDMVVHIDLAALFVAHFKTRLGLQSAVRGDGLGRPQPFRGISAATGAGMGGRG